MYGRYSYGQPGSHICRSVLLVLALWAMQCSLENSSVHNLSTDWPSVSLQTEGQSDSIIKLLSKVSVITK